MPLKTVNAGYNTGNRLAQAMVDINDNFLYQEQKIAEAGAIITGDEHVLAFRYLDENGDGTGNKQATGNYLSTPKSFFFTPSPGVIANMARLIVFVKDTGSFDSGGYGNNSSPLVNGIIIKSTINGEELEYTDGIPIKTNSAWARMCYDVSVSTFGAGDESLSARWTFTATGAFITMDADRGDKFEVILNDDFSHLVEHTFLIQGHKIKG